MNPSTSRRIPKAWSMNRFYQPSFFGWFARPIEAMTLPLRRWKWHIIALVNYDVERDRPQ